jgi:hypothetical protein
MTAGFSRGCAGDMGTRHLDIADVLVIAERLSGTYAADLQRESRVHMLESALLRPGSELDGRPIYPSLTDKAAALMLGLHRMGAVPGHGPALAWVGLREFLARNGARWHVEPPEPQVVELLFEGIDAGDVDHKVLSRWLSSEVLTPREEMAA